MAPKWKDGKPEGPFDVGAPVKLKFFSSPEGMLFNELVGDIVAVRMEKDKLGLSAFPQPMFDVRCPWRDPRTVKKEALEDKDHGHVLHSAFTADQAQENRALLEKKPVELPAMGGFSGRPYPDCPYILLTGIPQEKLEPLQEPNEAPPAPEPMTSMPPMPMMPPMQSTPMPPMQTMPMMPPMHSTPMMSAGPMMQMGSSLAPPLIEKDERIYHHH